MSDTSTAPEPVAAPATLFSAPGTIDAALDFREDQKQGQQPAPAPAPAAVETAPVPSEEPVVTEAAPESEFDALEAELLKGLPEELPGEAVPQPVAEPTPFAERLVTISLDDGSTTQMPRKEFDDGQLRMADYTRKTQEVAEQRRYVEAEQQAIVQQRQEYAQSIEVVQQLLQKEAPELPDESLRINDPIEYTLQKDAYRDHFDKANALDQENIRVQGELQKEATQKQGEVLQQAVQYITQVRPDLDTEEKFVNFAKTNKSYMRTQGFSEQESSNVYDPRAALILDKARRYDAMMARVGKRRQTAAAQPSGVPSISQSNVQPTPANSVSSDVKKADSQLTASGSVEDAVRLIHAQRAAR